MATAADILIPSKEKTNFLRLIALVIDGGTLALKTQFDAKFPPLNLGQDLQAQGNYQILYGLKSKKIITQAQFDLLFPPPTRVVDSSDFDVSLFSCLIRNLPAFQQHNSPIWKQPGPPPPHDVSLAAEVKRLRNLRNYLSHPPSAALSDQDFQVKWQETSDVIQRLCGTAIPDIHKYLANILQLSIDPEKEAEYIDKLHKMEEFDSRLERQEALVAEALARLKNVEETTESQKADMDIVRLDLDSQSTVIKGLSDELQKNMKKTEAILTDQETRNKMSSEFKGLMSRSKIYFEEKERNEFIETTTYTKAGEILDSKTIVILSGHPGEGKTTMAKRLLLKRFPTDRCVNLTEPADWKHLDFSLNLISAILIDDIFGSGVLDESLVKKWERKLDDLSKVINQKGICVIITSRHYILEETKQLFRSLPLFKKGNIQLLSSKDLTEDEKIQILEAHLRAEERCIEKTAVLMCVMSHASVFENLLFGTNEFLFGFPECVNLFAKHDDLYVKGPEFFSRPNTFVKSCIHQLYRDEDKFLALIVMWANDGQIINIRELDESKLSHRVTRIAKKFKFKLKGKLIRRLRKSLEYHIDGLLHFSKETGVFTFSHNVICDMVGLVIAEENPDEVLEFSTRGFLLTYSTTKATDDDFKFSVDEYLFESLARRFIGLMTKDISIEGFIDCGTSLFALNRGGKMKSSVTPKFAIDFSIIKHDSFQHEKFIDIFLDILTKLNAIEDIFAHEIMEMSGFFLRYGMEIEKQKYFLLSYSVFIGADLFSETVVSNNFLDRTALSEKEKAIEYTMALLFAVHHQNLSLVRTLVHQKTTSITEEAIYIAAHKKDMAILRLLLENHKRQKIENIEILNGNNGLIVSAKKGFTNAVKCFIDCGYDLTARNKDSLSALDKAVAHKREDVCELLVKAGAPLNKASGKFRRTPLHTAVDVGLLAATKCLIEHTAKLKTKDHKGFYPIHSAALNRHFDIIRALLEHDPGQASWLTKTYGKKSVLKGKTVFHIAVQKKDYELLSVLLETSASPNVTDLYGRTAFFEAVLSGNAKLINMLKDVSDLSIPDKNGFTPLHVAVYKGYFSLVQLLCSCPSVNVNSTDKYGKTPLHIAAIKGFSEIFLALAFLYGADWRMVTNRGDTILHLAVRARRIQASIELWMNKIGHHLLLNGSVSSESTEDIDARADNANCNDANNSEIHDQQRNFDINETVTAQNNEISPINNVTAATLKETGARDSEINGSTSDRQTSKTSDTGISTSNLKNTENQETNNTHAYGTESERNVYAAATETDDENFALRNKIVNELMEKSYKSESFRRNAAQAALDEYNSDQDTSELGIIKMSKVSRHDFDIIISTLATFDKEFCQKDLVNKYGRKSLFKILHK